MQASDIDAIYVCVVEESFDKWHWSDIKRIDRKETNFTKIASDYEKFRRMLKKRYLKAYRIRRK